MSNIKTKLSPESFPYPTVFRDELGGYWEYIGDSVREWRECAILIARTGERMKPLLGPPETLAHVAHLDFHMVLLLLGMTQQHKYRGLEWLRYASDFPRVSPGVGRNFSTNYNYLVHFGLTGKRQRRKNKSANPEVERMEYQVTTKGYDFLAGVVTCPEYLLNNGPIVLEEATEQVRIADFLSARWLRGFEANPLWWEREDDRMKYLKTAYAPVDWSKLPYIEDAASPKPIVEARVQPKMAMDVGQSIPALAV